MMRKRKAALPSATARRVEEVARRLNIGTSVIRQAIRNGELIASKLGDKARSPVIVEDKHVEDWLASKHIAPNGKKKK